MTAADCLSPAVNGVKLAVLVRPGARQSSVLGMENHRLQLAVAAPARQGEANQAVLGLLAKILSCPPSRLSLASGQSSRYKQILVKGLTVAEAGQRLAGWIASEEKDCGL
ncbi:MAG: DUF167 domain-containing protein [Negativicutes bacterium]|nr:DUF167 domain-containing protein [Negativicutes bacterium]